MKTCAPSATKSLAAANAIPDVAPVMTATFPSSLPTGQLHFDSLLGGCACHSTLASDAADASTYRYRRSVTFLVPVVTRGRSSWPALEESWREFPRQLARGCPHTRAGH